MSDKEALEQIREQFRVDEDARPVGVVAELGLDPGRWLSAAKAIADGEEPDLPAEREDEGGAEDETDEDPEPDDVPFSKSPTVWGGADFSEPEAGVWPSELLDREQWMGHSDKKPFAPWSDKNPDTACNSSDCPADRADDPDCDCDGRFKWSHEGHYVDGETVGMAEDDPRLDGRVFIQTDDDAYAFVDGDDVRDPETGEIHPTFAAILSSLGKSYADISTSGAGVHVYYRGELTDGIPQASWEIDDEPWGSNEDLPAIEIYANKHVCVATGDHVPGSGTEINEWNDHSVYSILDNNNQLRQTATDRSSIDLEGYEPEATEASETTTDIRDQFHALNRLDARKVAEETIVSKWNDDASTSEGARAFWPTWGSVSSDSGTANYVDSDIWNDTGKKGGYGGPLVMALIDAGEIRPEGASPADTRGENYFKAVEHLRELGFDIPKKEDKTKSPIPPSSKDAAATDGGSAAVDDAGSSESDVEDDTTPPEPQSADGSETDPYGDWQDIRGMFREADNADDRATPRFESAMKLHREESFANLQENEVLYAYDPERGIFDDNGKQVVRTKLTNGLEEQYRGHTMSEVMDQIRGRNTLSQREMGGPDGLIAARNCVIDLHEHTSREHSAEYRFLSRLGCEFDPEATAPEWHAFLDDAVPGETERKKLQEFVGYALHHWDLPFHKALFLVGPTASGKSTFLDTINELLGDGTVASLTPQQLTGERFGPAELFGKWANIRNDIPKSTVKNTGMFKELIAGDPMKAEKKNKDPFFFNPTAKHLFSANQLPEMEVDDEAFFRRILLVPFPETVPEEDRDKFLDEKLQDELPGILNWAIEGLQRLLGNGGFTGDRSPARTRETWSKWGDSVSRFAKHAITDGDDDIPKSDMYAAFLEFCRQESIPSDTQHKMTRELKQEGFKDDRAYVNGAQKRVFTGVSWTGRGEELLDAAQSPRQSEQDSSSDVDRRPTGLKDFD